MIRVAIVEDDPIMRGILCDAVNGCDDMTIVGEEDNIADATHMIDAGGYDVLLCDLGLPHGSGVDLIRQERRTDRDTDILVITMFANHRKVLEAIQAGARGYLLKDEQIEDCLEAIRNIRKGGSPISPIIARQLLKQLLPTAGEIATPLTEREVEILNLLSKGLSNSDCADVLSISSYTVGTHVKNIYRKLEVNSRAEALFEAASKGLLTKG